ncbi:hypothetical protein HYV10_03435 [Candidatus Dependentiae bacterium]|nr:hypothetical protein [Candidatus Dependentiae bacterium]
MKSKIIFFAGLFLLNGFMLGSYKELTHQKNAERTIQPDNEESVRLSVHKRDTFRSVIDARTTRPSTKGVLDTINPDGNESVTAQAICHLNVDPSNIKRLNVTTHSTNKKPDPSRMTVIVQTNDGSIVTNNSSRTAGSFVQNIMPVSLASAVTGFCEIILKTRFNL